MRSTGPVPEAGARAMGRGPVYVLAHILNRTDGGSRAGADIILALLAAGADVRVVSPDRFEVPATVAGRPVRPPAWHRSPEPVPRFRVRGRRLTDVAFSGAANLKALARTPVERRRLAAVGRAAPPWVIVQNGFPAVGDAWSALLDPDRRAQRVMVVHSSARQVPSFAANQPELSVESLRQRMAACDALVFVSPQIRDEWLEPMARPPAVVRVIPPCCRDEQIDALLTEPPAAVRQRLGLAEDAFVVACAGKVHPIKGQDLVVKALPELMKRKPNVHLLLIGAVTADANAILRDIEALGLQDRVTLTGAVRNPLDYIYAADLLIHASRAEGLGLVIAEAMALRTPVLASDAGGIPSLVHDGVTGLMFPVGDVDAMIARFAELLERPDDTAQRVARAEDHYRQHFARPAMVAAYEEFLGALAAR